MLSAAMHSLTRSFVSRVSLAALKTAPRLTIQRSPLINAFTPYRSFSITPSVFATAAAARAKKSTNARAKVKPKSKTTSKAKPKTKRKLKAKPTGRTAAKKTKKRAVAKPSSTRVPLIARPPKKPASAYFIFFGRTKTDVPKNRLEANEATKNAANIWNKMTDAEKKPFFDEFKVLFTDYEARRAKWYKDPKNAPILRKLNKDRKKHGKQRIHVPGGIVPKRPITGFLRFYNELRENGTLTQAQAPPSNKSWVTWAAREAGSKWNALPQAEKSKYSQQSHDAR